VGETHGTRKINEPQAVKRRQRLSINMLSPFHGLAVDVVLIPRVDTHG